MGSVREVAVYLWSHSALQWYIWCTAATNPIARHTVTPTLDPTCLWSCVCMTLLKAKKKKEYILIVVFVTV